MFPSSSALPTRWALPALLGLGTLLSGCVPLSPDGLRGQVARTVAHRVDSAALPSPDSADSDRRATEAQLAAPLDADAAVQIALRHNPGLQTAFATLGIADAERAQIGLLPNPRLAIGRLTEGDEREIERALRLDVLGVVTLPWRLRWQDRLVDAAQLQAAQAVVRLAADTRHAWLHAVAARAMQVTAEERWSAADAGAELARRMQRAGNWSASSAAREELVLAQASTARDNARLDAVAAHEALTRLLGPADTHGTPWRFTLPDALPPLPAALAPSEDAEATALRERLDVQATLAEARATAASLGLTQATGWIGALALGYERNTTFDGAGPGAGTRSTQRGWTLDIPTPLFDWGQARVAQARYRYWQSAARVREVALRARSEVRSADAARRSAWDAAMRARDTVLPAQVQTVDDTLLRYNGMLASPWDLLAAVRARAGARGAAIGAQRDYWLADADLQQATTGTSPQGSANLLAGTAAASTASFSATGSPGAAASPALPASPAGGH